MTKIPENSTKTKSYWWHWPVTLFFMALFISLGFWQLHRAELKQNLQQTYESRLNSPIKALAQLNSLADKRFYRAHITGRYDPNHVFYLDNKTHQGKPGYEIIHLFHPTDDNKAIWVNRGWIPSRPDRSHLPNINTPSKLLTLQGITYEPYDKPFLLSQKEEPQAGWPKRIQAIDLSKMHAQIKQPIYSFMILLDHKNEGAFVRTWQPVSMPSYKHIGYAVQWFLFALTLLTIVIVLKRRSKKHERTSKK